MHRFAIACALMIGLVPVQAISGGTSWLVQISEFSLGPNDSATVLVQSSDPDVPWGKCDQATISIKFDHLALIKQDAPPYLTIEEHRKALANLAKAAKSKLSIRFGEMGFGLKKSAQNPCLFYSRGLSVVEEYDHQQAIYSFHGPK